MHNRSFFTPDPQSDQHTWLFFRTYDCWIWLRMTLHVPYEGAIRAVNQGQFIPFEDPIPVNPSDAERAYANATVGTRLLEYIAAEIYELTRPRAVRLHGMHPDAKTYWFETNTEVNRRLQEALA
jgi:hypothetical protein